MDVIKQFDLEFEDLHACLNTWMNLSPVANEDLQSKRELLGNLADNLSVASTAYATALASVNDQHTHLNKAATTGHSNYLTEAHQFDLDLTKESGNRKDASKAAASEIGVCTSQNDTFKKGVVQTEGELDKGFKHHNTIAGQAQQGLTGQDTACRDSHTEIGGALSSMKTAVHDQGLASAKLIGEHSGLLSEHATQSLPKARRDVVNWVNDQWKPAKQAILDGVLRETGSAFSDFAGAVNKSISEGGGHVSDALITAESECGTARQELANYVTRKCRPTVAYLGEKQAGNQATFAGGFERVKACAHKLAEIRSKYEAVRKNTTQ